VGDVFLGANGEFTTLTGIVRVEQSGGLAVFNFTVEGNHNYFNQMVQMEMGKWRLIQTTVQNMSGYLIVTIFVFHWGVSQLEMVQ
jgi:hypothetical protein